MATKTTARRAHARENGHIRHRAGSRGVRWAPEAQPMEGLIAWAVEDVNGIENVIYTLSEQKPSAEARRVEIS
jgi:hypothetical protein